MTQISFKIYFFLFSFISLTNCTFFQQKEESLDEYIIRTIDEKTDEFGLNQKIIENGIAYNDINLSVEMSIVDTNKIGDMYLVGIEFIAKHENLFKKGIYYTDLTGSPKSHKEASLKLVERYVEYYLSPIMHSLYKSADLKYKLNSDLKNSDDIWHVFLGEFISGGFWQNWPKEQSEFNTPSAYIQQLEPILPEIIESNNIYYWIHIFIDRGGDGEVNGYCKINDLEWKEGFEKLKPIAEQWTKGGTLYLNQFIVLKRE